MRLMLPEVLRRRYTEFIPTHRLSPQILATLISNDIVNRMGPAFVKRVQLDTGADVVTIARAYTVARQIVRAGALNRTIEELDNVIPASAQMSMLFELSRTQRHATYWIIEHYGDYVDIDGLVDRPRPDDRAGHARHVQAPGDRELAAADPLLVR